MLLSTKNVFIHEINVEYTVYRLSKFSEYG
jgi:hypothetical protein